MLRLQRTRGVPFRTRCGQSGLAISALPTAARSKSARSNPASSGARLFSGKLPSPRIISAIELSSVIEPTVIVGFPVSFFVQVARFASVPNSPSQYLRWDRWNASTPARARGRTIADFNECTDSQGRRTAGQWRFGNANPTVGEPSKDSFR
jgi:hypothetical protein